jgi:hypothetical protein
MGWVVIRIRYPDFSSGSRDLAGLHGSAEHDAHGVTVYLLPGLTGRQRKAVIRRLRQEASRGFGPALPLPGLLLALGLDRVRAAGGIALAIVRLHPTVALLPGAAIAAVTLFVLAATGGGAGPVPRTGLGGVLAGSGRLASAAGSAASGSGVIAPAIAQGGSELGSGVPAVVWQARPHGRPGQQRARQHGSRYCGKRRGARQQNCRPGHRPVHRPGHRPGHRGCPGSRGPLASSRAANPACRRAAAS